MGRLLVLSVFAGAAYSDGNTDPALDSGFACLAIDANAFAQSLLWFSCGKTSLAGRRENAKITLRGVLQLRISRAALSSTHIFSKEEQLWALHLKPHVFVRHTSPTTRGVLPQRPSPKGSC